MHYWNWYSARGRLKGQMVEKSESQNIFILNSSSFVSSVNLKMGTEETILNQNFVFLVGQ